MFESRDNTSGFFNREAKDSSLEAAANTGREADSIVDDVGEVQETYKPLEDRVNEGIRQVMESRGLRSHDIGREMHGFFLAELQKSGKVTERDMRFNPGNVIAEALDKVAKRKAA